MQQDQKDNINVREVKFFLRGYFNYLNSRIIKIIILLILGFCLGIGFFFIQAPEYKGESTFILQEKGSSPSSLAGIASQLGLDIASTTSGSGGSLFAGENIIEILQSRNIIGKVLLSDINNLSNQNSKMIERYLKIHKYYQKWENKPLLFKISFAGVANTQQLQPVQDSVLQIVYKSILKKLVIERGSKKTTVISVTLTDKDPVLAKYFSERLINEAAAFYINVKTTLLRKNVERLERRADSILGLLNQKSYQVAELKYIDANAAIKNISVPSELASRDRTILLTLYAEVIKNLEYTRIGLVQETPLIQILDKPGITIFDNKITYLLSVVIFSVVLLFLYLAYSFYSFSINYRNTLR